MTTWTKVRDVVRDKLHTLPTEQRMLRVPYDLFWPTGPVRVEGGVVHYREMLDDQPRIGRFNPASLGDAKPGERVLLQLQTEVTSDAEWWLCEVMERGIAASTPSAPSPD